MISILFISLCISSYNYLKSKGTRILKISIKNFKGFRNVKKSIETSASELLNSLQSAPECTQGDLGVLMLKEM